MVRADYFDDYRNLPEYTDTMFLDGFNAQQIWTAAHKKMMAEYQPEDDGTEEVVIKSEVTVK